MGKSTKLVALFGIIIVIIAAGLIFVYFNLSPEEKTQSEDQEEEDNLLIYIFVNSSLYNNISFEIERYVQDVKDQGYDPQLINWSSSDVVALKQNLTDAYELGLEGAILVGKFPYALGRFWDPGWGVHRTYPLDLYLTDLDGTWTDTNGDLAYNFDMDDTVTDVWYKVEHNDGASGDMLPEIWLGRICPEYLNNVNHTKAYKQYFQRNHDFRTGNLIRPHSAFYLVDDDWSAYISEWLSNFTAYTNVTAVSDNYLTNRTSYLSHLSKIYEFVHLMAHSWPYEHQFTVPSLPMEYVYPSDILNTNTKALFYNLFCCYACNYTYTNNMGTHYLFSNNTLCVVGSTRSGGTWLYQPFYDSLNEGKCFGDAVETWFQNPEIFQNDNWEECTGVTILGDPLLAVK